jgi:hypothetical protein
MEARSVTYSPAELELGRYLASVYDNPRKPGEGAIAYIVRIAELVAGGPLPKPKEMASVGGRLPYRDSE